MSSTKALPPIAWVAPDRLTLLPGNPRSGDIEAISRSIQEFGFLVPVVVNSDGLVIAGNHRVAAARQLGLDAVPETSVWDFDRPARSDDHPTQKPLGLIQRCIRNITHKGEIVVDPFLGSGTTLLASDIDGRVCFGMELDPRYVDVICRRWQTLTGQQPVLEATGEPHGFEGA